MRAQGAELYAIERIAELIQNTAEIVMPLDPQPVISQRTTAFNTADREDDVQLSQERLIAAKNLVMTL